MQGLHLRGTPEAALRCNSTARPQPAQRPRLACKGHHPSAPQRRRCVGSAAAAPLGLSAARQRCCAAAPAAADRETATADSEADTNDAQPAATAPQAPSSPAIPMQQSSRYEENGAAENGASPQESSAVDAAAAEELLVPGTVADVEELRGVSAWSIAWRCMLGVCVASFVQCIPCTALCACLDSHDLPRTCRCAPAYSRSTLVVMLQVRVNVDDGGQPLVEYLVHWKVSRHVRRKRPLCPSAVFQRPSVLRDPPSDSPFASTAISLSSGS